MNEEFWVKVKVFTLRRSVEVTVSLPSFQMYIALISLHSLVMVVFHFLYCFEDDWTSKLPACITSDLSTHSVFPPQLIHYLQVLETEN